MDQKRRPITWSPRRKSKAEDEKKEYQSERTREGVASPSSKHMPQYRRQNRGGKWKSTKKMGGEKERSQSREDMKRFENQLPTRRNHSTVASDRGKRWPKNMNNCNRRSDQGTTKVGSGPTEQRVERSAVAPMVFPSPTTFPSPTAFHSPTAFPIPFSPYHNPFVNPFVMMCSPLMPPVFPFFAIPR